MASCCKEKCQAVRYEPTIRITHQGKSAWYHTSAAQAEYSTSATIHVGPSIRRNVLAMASMAPWGSVPGRLQRREGGMHHLRKRMRAPEAGGLLEALRQHIIRCSLGVH